MMRAVSLAVVLISALFGGANAQTRDQQWTWCKDQYPDVSIGGCTALIQSGQETPNNLAMAFNNRGLAYVGEKDYARALQDYDQAISIDPKDSDAYTNRGFDHFFLGQFAAAQSDLAIAVADSPTNRYRVLWLYLAASRAGQNAQADLETNAAKLNLTNWPGPVVQLYLGKITSAEFLTAATISDAKKNREQHCEAYFYLGEQALIAGRRIEARRLFQQSIDTGVTNFDEYDGAQTELKRLPPTTAAGSH